MSTAATGEQGHKALAAIVFTDVVGFARHAHDNEQRALADLQRDIEILKSICARTNGTVLKTMGDGILMRFPTAHEAMQCALEIQRVLHEQAKSLDPRDVLWHRIGVHLGDVVVTADDVYGDGVNVAARLQAEAGPGTILFSRTVYDVVKNKLKLNAKYLGPRQLKGITEPIPTWEVPALAKQELDKRHEALAAMNMPPVRDAQASGRATRAIMLTFLAILLAGVAGAMMFLSMSSNKLKSLPPRSKTLTINRPNGERNPPVSVAPPPETKDDSTDPLDDKDLFDRLQPLFAQDAFSDMAQVVQESRFADSQAGKDLIDRYQTLENFMVWLDKQIDLATEQAPIQVSMDPDTKGPVSVYRVTPGMVEVKGEQGTISRPLRSLSKAETCAIASAILNGPGEIDESSRALVANSIDWMTADAARYQTP